MLSVAGFAAWGTVRSDVGGFAMGTIFGIEAPTFFDDEELTVKLSLCTDSLHIEVWINRRTFDLVLSPVYRRNALSASATIARCDDFSLSYDWILKMLVLFSIVINNEKLSH